MRGLLMRSLRHDGGEGDVRRLGRVLPVGGFFGRGPDRPHLCSDQLAPGPFPLKRPNGLSALHGTHRAWSQLRPRSERGRAHEGNGPNDVRSDHDRGRNVGPRPRTHVHLRNSGFGGRGHGALDGRVVLRSDPKPALCGAGCCCARALERLVLGAGWPRRRDHRNPALRDPQRMGFDHVDRAKEGTGRVLGLGADAIIVDPDLDP